MLFGEHSGVLGKRFEISKTIKEIQWDFGQYQFYNFSSCKIFGGRRPQCNLLPQFQYRAAASMASLTDSQVSSRPPPVAPLTCPN